MKKIILLVALSVLTLCALGQNQSVGIGTTNPSSRLDVVGSSSTDTLLNIRSSGLSSKVVVLNNGNTGIGVTNPASRLDIKEKMRLSLPGSEAHLRFSGFWGGNNQNYNINIFDDSSDPGTLHMFRDSPGQMAIGNVNGFPSSWGDFSDKLLVSGNAVLKKGNLGIGTGDPQKKLEVQDGSLLLDAEAQYGGDYAVDNDDYSDALLIGGKGAESGLKIFKQDPGSSNSFIGINQDRDSYVFEMTDANDNDPDGGVIFAGTGKDNKFEDIMTVRGNGKVGIGTTQPRAMLSLWGDTPHILFSNLNGGAPSWRIGQQTSSNGGNLILRTYSNSERYVRVQNKSTNTASMTVQGKVGIGKKYPGASLHLGSGREARFETPDDGGKHEAIRIRANNDDVDLLRVGDTWANSSDYGFSLRYVGTRTGNDNSLSIFADQQQGSQTEAMTILQDGNIGIGTTNPGRELHIKGKGIKLEKNPNSSNWWLISQWNNGNNLNIYGANGSKLELQRDANNGTVRIGKSASGVTLQMHGRIDMNNHLIEGTPAIKFNNNEQGQITKNGRVYWDQSAGLYVHSGNAPNSNSSGGRLLWSGANVKEGNGIDISYNNEDLPTIKVDESQADDQNLTDVLSEGNNTGNHNIDFNSDGSINSVNNINVSTMSSNNGNSPIDFNQGISIDGSDGGGGPVIIENSKSGSGSHNANHSVALGGDGGEYFTMGKVGGLFGNNNEGYLFEVHDESDGGVEGGVRFQNRDKNGNVDHEWLTMRGNDMIVDQSGAVNVGIGTGNPEALLHVGDQFNSGGENLQIGDDAYMSDLDIANTIGLYGKQDPTQGSIKFGSSGPRVSGNNGRLWVCGQLSANEVKVQQIPGQWCDYVFQDDYNLRSIESLGAFVDSNHHLPGIPTSEEVSKNGVNVGKMQKRYLEKIEELTLYVINLNKRNKALERQVNKNDQNQRKLRQTNRQLREKTERMAQQNRQLQQQVDEMNKQLRQLQREMKQIKNEARASIE